MPQTKCIHTRNKVIMECAVKYAKEKQKNDEELAPLNQMRACEKMIFPCKIVGLIGKDETHARRHSQAKSCLKWKIEFSSVPKLSKKKCKS